MKTILLKKNDKDYDYSPKLTKPLDSFSKNKLGKLNQDILNQIILWKVNRYAEIDKKLLKRLNKFKKVKTIDIKETKEVLNELLCIEGISLPMATTILRFVNPFVFQILDRRAYRVAFGVKTFNRKVFSYNKSQNVRDTQIKTYLDYLNKLKEIIIKYPDIEFFKLDRVLYKADIRINKAIK